jgi:quercetin dioxygenase-like cupin family protein
VRIVTEKALEGKRWTLSRGEASSKHIIDMPEISVSVSVVAPHSELPDEPHTHERHEMLYVSKGSVRVSVGQEVKTASSGDFIIFEPYEGQRPSTGEDETTLFEVFWASSQ